MTWMEAIRGATIGISQLTHIDVNYVCQLFTEDWEDFEVAVETGVAIAIVSAIRQKKVFAELSDLFDYPIVRTWHQRVTRAEIWLDECPDATTIRELGKLVNICPNKLLGMRTEMYPGYYDVI